MFIFDCGRLTHTPISGKLVSNMFSATTRVLKIHCITICILTASCATAPPSQIAIKTHELPPIDDSPWHVCIDPGHGGPWPGAIAPSNGLRECDVNLNVALRLRDLLQAEGYRVTLTRTADTALTEESVSADLRARAQIANDSRADIFVSIHHNADIIRPSTKNDLEIYYARRDPLASRALGAELVRALSATVASDARHKRLLPGNYNVLRNTEMPAVLTETAYLTDPDTAARLAQRRAIKDEANSIFLGVKRFFDTHPPLRARIIASQGPDGRTKISARARNPIRIIDVRAGGQPVRFTQATSTSSVILTDPLPTGTTRIAVRLRTATSAPISQQLDHTVRRSVATVHGETMQPTTHLQTNALHAIAAQALDRFGFPVPGAEITFHEKKTADANGRVHFTTPVQRRPVTHTLQSETQRVTLTIPPGEPAGAHSVIVMDAADGKPIARARVTSSDEVNITNDIGWTIAPTAKIRVDARGYVHQTLTLRAPHSIITLTPSSTHHLLGRRIVLDPVGGGRRSGAVGPDGLRSSDTALIVAEMLATALRAQGADVLLARVDQEEVGELSRVERGEAHAPELYIAISFGLDTATARIINLDRRPIPPTFAAHYPGSQNGMRFAALARTHLNLEGIVPSVYYPVQQMSCPAVLIQPHDVRESENELYSIANLETIAQHLFRATEVYFRP